MHRAPTDAMLLDEGFKFQMLKTNLPKSLFTTRPNGKRDFLYSLINSMHRNFKVFDTVGWHGQTLFVRVFSILQRFSRTNEVCPCHHAG